MYSEIRQVGNSKGIILPKTILEQCHFRRAIDMQVIDGSLVIRPISERRAGWKEAFLNAKPDDESLTEDWLSFPNESDGEDW